MLVVGAAIALNNVVLLGQLAHTCTFKQAHTKFLSLLCKVKLSLSLAGLSPDRLLVCP